MKIMKYAVMAIAALAVASCTKDGFHIVGEIKNAPDSLLYLENMSLEGPVKVDSVRLSEDGKFDLGAPLADAPEFYRLRIDDKIINLSVDSTETITVKATYPNMATDYTVEGSENCAKIKELSLMQIDLLNKAIAVDNNTSLGVEQARDSINALVEAYKQKVKMDYVFREPNKAYSYFALFQALGNRLIFSPQENEDDMRAFAAVATCWDTYYPGSERGLNLHNIALEGIKTVRTVQARQQGPVIDMDKVTVSNIIDIPLVDNKGKKRSLTELKGKVVLLDFHAFSMDDSPARIMMMRELYNKYSAQGFEIYQVAVDPNEHFWKTQTAALPWVNVFDPEGVESVYLQRYNVQTIPTFFLIDRENSLYKRDAQISDLDAEIKSLLH